MNFPKNQKMLLITGILLVALTGFVYADNIIAKAGNFFVDGKLGIGDTNPTYKLDVEGNASLNSTLYVVNQKVGIKTTSPSTELYVQGDATVTGIMDTNKTCFGGCTNSSMYWDGDNLIIKVN